MDCSQWKRSSVFKFDRKGQKFLSLKSMSAFPNVWKDQQTQQTQRQSSRGSVNESNVGPSTNDDRQALTKLQFQ